MSEQTDETPQTNPPSIEEAAAANEGTEGAGSVAAAEEWNANTTRPGIQRSYLQTLRAEASKVLDTKHDENAWRQVEEELERAGLLI